MLTIINPASGETIAEHQTETEKTFADALTRARKAQQSWQETPYASRAKVLNRFAELLAERKAVLAQTLTAEMGKPIVQAENEIAGTIGRIEYFVANAERCLEPEEVTENRAQGLRERITFEPLGVVGNISAWNYPYFVGINVIAPALLTGNVVLYKPSEYATGTGIAISELLLEAGLPQNVLQPLIGAAEVGAMLTRSALDGIFFTGSVATGKTVATAVASQFTKLQLELGGKDPVYVCEDVDVAEAAASVADGAFYNTGQSCCGVERVYVRKEIAEQFIKEFTAVVDEFTVGDPCARSTYIGPLTREAQLSVLEAQVKDAVEKGASLLCGGARIDGDGNYFQPTVLSDVDHKMLLMREESFGPIIGIQVVASDAEAVQLMNDTDYGLTAGVFTKDSARAERLLAGIDSGTAYVNCSDRVVPQLPWSGRRCSGLGVTMARQGIEAFLRPRAWHIKG